MEDGFYAYQFSAAHRPTIHRGSCPHCRNGQGRHKPQRATPADVAWRKLEDVSEANVSEFAHRDNMRLCGQCLADKR